LQSSNNSLSKSRQKINGCIVNLSSGLSRVTLPSTGSYSISKIAVSSYSSSLRRELSHLGIRIVCLEPGFVRTPLATDSVKITECSKSIAKEALLRVTELTKESGIRDESKWQLPTNVAEYIFDALFTSNYYPHVVVDKLMFRIKYHLLFILPYVIVDRYIAVKRKSDSK